jgi:UDP:flavonoid glycosyltransferase YjiC (YdhE family)
LPDPIIYLSLGSLGAVDVELMRRLVAELADGPFRVVVAKGPRATEIDLPSNIAGAEFLPQASILPKVDLVITHGGANTVNAHRLHERAFGIRLDTYRHQAGELTAAIGRRSETLSWRRG